VPAYGARPSNRGAITASWVVEPRELLQSGDAIGHFNDRDVSRLHSVPKGGGEHMSTVAGYDVRRRPAAELGGVDERPV